MGKAQMIEVRTTVEVELVMTVGKTEFKDAVKAANSEREKGEKIDFDDALGEFESEETFKQFCDENDLASQADVDNASEDYINSIIENL